MSEMSSSETRAAIAERVLQAVEAWRAEYTPRCAESCYQMDRCVINAPQLVEDVMNIAGYHKDTDDE